MRADQDEPVAEQLIEGIGVAIEHGLLTPILEQANLTLAMLYVHGLAIADWTGAGDVSAWRAPMIRSTASGASRMV